MYFELTHIYQPLICRPAHDQNPNAGRPYGYQGYQDLNQKLQLKTQFDSMLVTIPKNLSHWEVGQQCILSSHTFTIRKSIRCI